MFKISCHFNKINVKGKGGNTGDITGVAKQFKMRVVNLRGEKGGGSGGQAKVSYTYQATISAAMATIASSMHISFIVSLGDNFYDNGVTIYLLLCQEVFF